MSYSSEPHSSVPAPGVLGRVARTCHRHPWLTLLSWIAIVAYLIVMWTQFGAPADNNFTSTDPGTRLINQHFARQSGDRLTLAIRSAQPIKTAAARERITAALIPFARAPHVTSVGSPYQVPGQISADGHIAFATVQFDVGASKIPRSEVTALMNDARAASGHGMTFNLGGDVVDMAETPQGGSSEGIGVAAAAIVLLISFGSVLAMGLPIVTALFGIGSGLSLIALIGHLIPAPSFAPVVASLIGLGVGVDYALFIVTRFREALRSGRSPESSVVTAFSTAGRAVLFAGTTVIIAVLGLLVLRQSLMNGVAIAAAATVACVMLGSLTLLPALLGFTGARLAKPSRFSRIQRRGDSARGRYVPAYGQPSEAPARAPLAERWAGVVQRRPVIATVASAIVILALAAPVLSMKLNLPDESTQARDTMGYKSYQTMAEGFGPGFNAPLIIVAKLPPGAAGTVDTRALRGIDAAVRATPGVARVTPPTVSADRAAAMMIAYPSTSQQNTATNDMVNRLRDTVLPRATAGTGVHAYVGGPNAGAVDFADLVNQRLPWLIGIVVGVSVLLLVVVFRSATIAIKAAAMNLLSISAAYGVLTAVAQWGWLGHLFGFPEKMPVATWVPMFLFVILFGLSMDYEVFLLSRIREEYDRTGDNATSVARGLARTARVISAAAAIMVVVFLSVVLGADVAVKQIGLGLAVAVLIDATLVRLVLVPAVMELLGKANWWLPRPLARILPDVRFEDHSAVAPTPQVPERLQVG
ncbi:MAG: MMPL family transporter [Micromonosporaceae bacterium]